VFDFWYYHIFREVVGLERGPLSLVSTTEVLLGRKSSGSGVENREYGSRDPPRSGQTQVGEPKIGEHAQRRYFASVTTQMLT
jgi:hypothetical protein